ncbi:MAG: citrate lyase acyl carrier protein [Bacilli bacterium]|jgi:citrate lyase subunit gamma (acyl carrier protein)|nr:citrate lyase acyl carrier protein [Bacilli bacterium]MDY0063804.1 citrate lyase acyl carrier protein [Bacilli bacterium]
MKIGVAGTEESNDVKITVKYSDEIEIHIESIVYEFYGEQIEKTIRNTLQEMGIEKLYVLCQDKGALDYTIRSRLITAINRMNEKE